MSDETRLVLPPNSRIGAGSVVTADPFHARAVFQRFRSQRDVGLIIGERCVIDTVTFGVGPNGLVEIGDDCHLEEAFLLSELHLKIGNGVSVGWHATIADSDFHPLPLAERRADAVALSPAGREGKLPRPDFTSRAVVIGDGVWMGPNVMVLKGVHIGDGAIIEPGSVVTRDVPAGARVLGNPARVVDEAPR